MSRISAMIAVILFLSSPLHSEEACPVELKLLLSPPTIKTVLASMGFEKETKGRVYFFDTDNRSLLAQGVIVRVRQDGSDDLIVKVRLPENQTEHDIAYLRDQFPCEIDRTGTEASTSFTVGQKYKPYQVPSSGADILSALSPGQQKLLQEAHVSIDWSRVKRVADINSTTWQAKDQPQFRKLSLERWEWSAGDILELSIKVASSQWRSKSAELQQLVNSKGLSLNASQVTKTSIALRAPPNDTAPAK